MTEQKSKSTLLLRIVLLLIALGIVALAARMALQKPPEAKPVEEKPVPVTIQRIQTDSLDNRINLPGKLQAYEDLMIPIEKPGTLVEVPVDRGASVTQGQLLCRMDARIWEDALKQAEINDREASKEWKRWEEIHKSGAISVSDYDLYKTRAEAAEIALNNAQVNLEKCTVSSPVDGYINNRFIDRGEYVNEGQPIFHILRLDRMKLLVEVPERNISSLRIAQPLPFQVAALPGLTFTGRITFIAAQISGAGNSFTVEASVDNPDTLLKAGMIADVQVSVGKLEDVIAIPLAAVIPDKGEYVVFIHRNGASERRIVRIAEIRGTRVVIQFGLEEGDELIVEGHRALADGMPVEILQQMEN